MRRLALRDFKTRHAIPLNLQRDFTDHDVVTSYGVDSRHVKAGQLFFALKGARADGHDFLAEVAAAGALAAVVDKAYTGPHYGLPLFMADDVLAVLQQLARESLASDRSIIVAVTGSVGKTTTKEFIGYFLSQHYRTAVSPGNHNSQIGLPLAILNHTTGQEEVLVLEMGMTLPNQIRTLISIAPPDIALITTVALAHAGNFEGLEAIARAKGEILSCSRTSVGLFPREVPYYDILCQLGSCRKRSFSLVAQDADYRLTEVNGRLAVVTAGQTHELGFWTLPGFHNRHNLVAAIAVARELKLPWEEIVRVMPTLSLPERRFQRIERNGITFINDAYNAPPIAVQAALSTLPEPKPGGCRIAVLGPMPELGRFSVDCHRQIGQYALGIVDQMFCLGEECQPIYEVWQSAGQPVSWFFDRDLLFDALDKQIKPGDVVLIKGANVYEMWRFLEVRK